MAEMPRRRRSVLVVLGLLLLAEGLSRLGAVQRLFDPADGSTEAARWRYAYAQATPTVLVMGDSRAVIDLSPTEIRNSVQAQAGGDISVLSIASYGSSAEHAYLMLTEVVLKSVPSPELVLLNVSDVALNDRTWIGTPPLNLRGLSRPLAPETWRSAPGRAAVLETLSGLVRLRHRSRLTVEGRWPNYIRGSETYDCGGSVWHDKMRPEALQQQFSKSRDEYLVDFCPDGVQGDYLLRLLRQARAAGVHLVLVITPVTEQYLSAFPAPGDAQRFVDFVHAAGAAHGVPVLDYYRTAELEDEHYFDLHHTNAEGTALFSRLVTRDIVVPALADWQDFCSQHAAR